MNHLSGPPSDRADSIHVAATPLPAQHSLTLRNRDVTAATTSTDCYLMHFFTIERLYLTILNNSIGIC